MKPSLFTLFIAAHIVFAAGVLTGYNATPAAQEPNAELSTLQSALDHERTLNKALSRRLEREEQGNQLTADQSADITITLPEDWDKQTRSRRLVWEDEKQLSPKP